MVLNKRRTYLRYYRLLDLLQATGRLARKEATERVEPGCLLFLLEYYLLMLITVGWYKNPRLLIAGRIKPQPG